MYAYPPSTRLKVLRLTKQGYTYNEAASLTKVSASTVFNWIKEARIAKTKTVKITRRKARQ